MFVITKNFPHINSTCYLTELSVNDGMLFTKYEIATEKAIKFKREREALNFAISNRIEDYLVIKLGGD